ncbi:MAG: hypothetical protein DBX55_09605 [Verrucomicrobia bacterium]|nr:MAG: hypothetical protein DBX55_09605 [Verrucomicrobiota bacterium]
MASFFFNIPPRIFPHKKSLRSQNAACRKAKLHNGAKSAFEKINISNFFAISAIISKLQKVGGGA